jgi:hypothetical protein
MKNLFLHSIIYISVFLVGFVLGVFYTATNTNELNRPLPLPPTHPINPDINLIRSQLDHLNKKSPNQVAQQLHLTPKDIKSLAQQLPEEELERQLQLFMPENTLALISDKKSFALRAIDEAFSTNDSQPLIGQIRITTSSNFNAPTFVGGQLPSHQKLYAQLDTFGKVPATGHVFIRWLHRDSGKILMFQHQRITENRNQNWVSFTPNDGWKSGTYDVKFYEFNNTLSPVAQTSYTVIE